MAINAGELNKTTDKNQGSKKVVTNQVTND
jgi:hypothetical protein